MKKFMIFLLMAFLYIGTCQARSESSHPNDAQLKLLSWVSPTPSQSFMTRGIQRTDADGCDIQIVEGYGSENMMVGQEIRLEAIVPSWTTPDFGNNGEWYVKLGTAELGAGNGGSLIASGQQTLS